MSALTELGVEYWRLTTSLSSARTGPTAVTRHALRRIGEVLARCEIEVRSLEGHPFDAGLAVQVVHSEDDPHLPEGQTVIAETVSPMVLWRGQVIRPAEVVTRRGVQR
jgi:hypothetical protein